MRGSLSGHPVDRHIRYLVPTSGGAWVSPYTSSCGKPPESCDGLSDRPLESTVARAPLLSSTCASFGPLHRYAVQSAASIRRLPSGVVHEQVEAVVARTVEGPTR